MQRIGKCLFSINIVFNMDTSLIIRVICLEMAIHVLKFHLEGRMSKNVDIGIVSIL